MAILELHGGALEGGDSKLVICDPTNSRAVDRRRESRYQCSLPRETNASLEKRPSNGLTKTLDLLALWRAELTGGAVKSKYNWHWLVDSPRAADFVAHLTNITSIKNTKGSSSGGG
jgi:hypothetical protein